MFTIEYRNQFDVVQTKSYPGNTTEFTVLPGFNHRETNTPIVSHLTALKLLSTHGTVGTDGKRNIVFYRHAPWTIGPFQLTTMIWIVFCVVSDQLTAERTPFYFYAILYVFMIPCVAGILCVAKPVWDVIKRVWDWFNKDSLKTDIATFTGIRDYDRIAKLCEKHNYNKLAVLRELLKE